MTKNLTLSLFLGMMLLLPETGWAGQSLSYSGRLVESNGSPVAGPVNLKFELAYTEAGGVGAVLCRQTISSVSLSNGVFHVKLDPDCTPLTLVQVLAQTPDNESLAIRVTDLSVGKTYSYQALYSIPYAQVSRQLPAMGATSGQVLKWNGSSWAPSDETGSGDGTVTQINTGSGLIGGPITGSGTISIEPAGVLDGHLANGINPAKLAGVRDGTKYLKGDNSWGPFGPDVLATLLNGYVGPVGSNLSSSDSILQGMMKLDQQVSGKLDKTGGTLSVGTIDGVPDPVADNQVANKAYVDNQISSVNDSQWVDVAPNDIHFSVGKVGIGTTAPIEKLDVVGNVALTGKLRLQSANLNYVEFKAPADVTATVVYELPKNKGTAGQALITDNDGKLSWGSAAADTSSLADDSIAMSKVSGLAAALAAKEDDLPTGGTVNQVLNGLKQWMSLTTTQVSEGSNLYFTDARARSALSVTSPSPIAYDSSSGALGFVAPGSSGNLLRSTGTNWESWTPNYLTSEADTLQTVSDRGGATTTTVTLSGGANFSGNGVWKSDGKVGIGTTNPGELFQIGEPSVAGAAFRFSPSADESSMRFTTNSSANWIQSGVNFTGGSSKDLRFSSIAGINTWMTIQGLTGNVGIGTALPRSRLEVQGGLQIGNDLASCDATKVGTLRYSGGLVHFCNGTNWRAFGVDGGSMTSLNGSTSTTQTLGTGSTGLLPNWSTAAGVHTLNLPLASSAGVTAGLISKSEFDTFNNKLTSLTGTSPVSVTSSTTPVISLSQASTTSDGYLNSVDWNTFNDKQNALVDGASINGIIYPALPTQTLQVPLAPVQLIDVVNKQYVDSQVATATNQWSISSGNVYRPTGRVAVGTDSPFALLSIFGLDETVTLAAGRNFPAMLNINSSNQTAGSETNILFTSNYSGSNKVANASIAVVKETSGSGANYGQASLVFRTSGATIEKLNSEKMRILGSGRVGIGTSTPSEKLTVTNTTLETPANSNNRDSTIAIYGDGAAYFQGRDVTNDIEYMMGTSIAGEAFAGSITNHDFSLRTNNTNRVTINTSGNVGIGIAAASEKLHVNGKTLAVAYEYSSDERLKKNIVQIPFALDKVNQLSGVTFDWRVDEYPERNLPSEKTYGFIAQEVEKHVPELVSTGSDGFKSVQYGNITALLVEAMKELFTDNVKTVEQQKKLIREIASLEEKNKKLQLELDAMKNQHSKDMEELRKSIQELKKR